ncbi:MAG: rRNA maturation RNase YbeY [Xanthobacteraceae bacterium]
MTRAPRRPCKIDLLVQSERWEQQRGFKSTLRRAIGAAAGELSTSGAELAIVLTDDSAVRLLNRKWRGIDKATNVLSFPTGTPCGTPPLIGDIVLAYETIAREGRDQGKPFAHHLAHLAVHGFLHLFGYDHRRRVDAEAMERLEGKILRRLAIPDPYRSQAARGRPPAIGRPRARSRRQ